jgi:acyl-coenzyme A thioesterase PaaI-like protein
MGLCCSLDVAMAMLLTIEKRHLRGLAILRIRSVGFVSSRLDNVVRFHRTVREGELALHECALPEHSEGRKVEGDITYLNPPQFASDTPLLRLRMPSFLP